MAVITVGNDALCTAHTLNQLDVRVDPLARCRARIVRGSTHALAHLGKHRDPEGIPSQEEELPSSP